MLQELSTHGAALMIQIYEIFRSIQGESTCAGYVTTFVRLVGCNLRCDYCDTTYAYSGGTSYSLNDLTQLLLSDPSRYICITGGEPLLQPEVFDLMERLCNANKRVVLETNGSLSCLSVDLRVNLVVDVKTPGSGAGQSFCEENLHLPHPHIEYKFVIGSEDEFDWAENFCKINHLFEQYVVLYSPSFEKNCEKWLAKKIVAKTSLARLHLQLHKYIGTDESIKYSPST